MDTQPASTGEMDDPAGARLRPEMASRRLLILDFVRRYITRWGFSPSQGEIAAHAGTNTKRVKDALRSLERDGLLKRTPGTRGLALPETEAEALRMLGRLGWIIDADGGLALAPGKTVLKTTLQVAPVLDYIPELAVERQGGVEYGEGRSESLGEEGAGFDRASSRGTIALGARPPRKSRRGARDCPPSAAAAA